MSKLPQRQLRAMAYKAIILAILLIILSPIHAIASQELTISTQSDQYKFNVEIVRTAQKIAKGLMFRKEMADNYAMLFDFTSRKPQIVHMWMKNTYIPLDMLFINHEGHIKHIAKNTTPLSLDIIKSKYPISAVLEINAGLSDELNIQINDKIIYPIFTKD